MTQSATRTDHDEVLRQIRDEILRARRLLITSHAKPDGDSIGSQVAMALALRQLGKEVRLVNCDPPQPALAAFPGVSDIETMDRIEGDFDLALVMECSDLARTGVAGLDRYRIVNIDHHPGNAMYGAVNWFDAGAAACGEMAFDVIRSLGVPLNREMAMHIYVAILTDTGSFHHSTLSPRTFDICRQALEAGADPVWIARTVYDSNTVGRIRLFSAVLSTIDLDASGRLATIRMDREMARVTGGSYDDTEGLINEPLTVKSIQAVAFFKEWEPGVYRVSFRSKGEIDVRSVAQRFGGGGHKNAAGCTVTGDLAGVRERVIPLVGAAIERGLEQGA
jgi:bifunctional oligoribonuclease and PAP phosphatase NrnA